ncbi:hypothetical protein LCGC14_1547550 [marine sediment metagenome]|uniref:Uncharacterized protein n=1 Tax=marine sediment metagenome TaxID=412755 RepID=A0A0F9L775_9ZZZZ
MAEKQKASGEDFMRCLPDICESLFPHAVTWRECIFASNVDPRGVVHGQENRDEIEVLDEFIAICRTLGLDGS